MPIQTGALIDCPERAEEDGASAIGTGIERMFPECAVLWVANPKDDLSRSFFDSSYRQNINDNSIPYVASEDWRHRVRLLIEAADLIVMSNTRSGGGLDEEIALLKHAGAIDKTFFANPRAVDMPSERVRHIDDLTPASLDHATDGDHGKLLQLPPWRHWAGPESMEYSRHYVTAVDACAGHARGVGRHVSHDVFAAVFMALIALLIFRAELRQAAQMQRALAEIVRRQPDAFSPHDVLARDVLVESADWYEAHADEYCLAHALQLVDPNTS